MHILLAAATTLEIQAVLRALEGPDVRAGQHKIRVLITGVGAIAATWSLSRQIERQRPDLVVQAGIAGCLTDLPLGEVVSVAEDEPADLGAWEEGKFRSLFDLGLADAEGHPYSKGRLINPYRQLLQLTSLAAVRAITVNEITTSAERIRWYQQHADAAVESMEGAALHYVCLQAGVPFLQLRSVSNRVGVRDRAKWEIGLAVRRMNETLMAFLSHPDLSEELLHQS